MRALPWLLVLSLLVCCADDSGPTADGPPVHDAAADRWSVDTVADTQRDRDPTGPDVGTADVTQPQPDKGGPDLVGTDSGGCGSDGTPCELDHDSCTHDECQGGQCITTSVSINKLSCTGNGQPGMCMYGVCCTGCLAGNTCAAGTTDTSCGTAGTACSDCTTSPNGHCCNGTCNAGPCP